MLHVIANAAPAASVQLTEATNDPEIVLPAIELIKACENGTNQDDFVIASIQALIPRKKPVLKTA